ncbi:MAG: hypothetical protein IJ574_05890 [Bacilli bacterium]|nr:hypothetical protein [Bacilli bacterium]
MTYLIPILYFLFFTISLVVITKKSFGKCLPLSVFISSFIMFFSVILFKTFNIGFWINVLLALSFIIIIPFYIWKKTIKLEEIKNLVFTKGFYAYIICSIAVFVYDYNRGFTGWDEFSHWGVMIKEMLRLDSLYSVKSSTLLVHKDYPPIVQIYELLFVKLSGGFSEERLISSIHLLEMMLFIPAICEIRLNKSKISEYFSGIALFFIVLFLILFLDCHSVMNCIYTDYVMAILVGYIMFSIISEKDNFKLFQIVNLTLAFSFLLLTKQMGLPLFAMCIFLIILDMILKKQIKLKNVVKLAVIIIIPFLFWKGWDIYVNKLDLVRQFKFSDINLSNLYNIILGSGGEEWQHTTVMNYLKGISNIPNTTSYIQLNYYQLVAFGLAMLLVLYKFFNKYFYKKQVQSIFITLLIGALGYAFTMLVLYVFSFGAGEGPTLASFNRYMPTYVMIIFSMLIMLFLHFSNLSKKYNNIYFLAILMLIIQSPNVLDRITFPIIDNTNSIYKLNAECIENDIKDDSKVYIIAQDSAAEYQYFIKYYLDDNIVNTTFYNLENDNSIDIIDYFYSQVYPLIKNYDYLYLAKINDDFKNNYSFLFDNEVIEHQLYKIIVNKGKIKFILEEWCEL